MFARFYRAFPRRARPVLIVAIVLALAAGGLLYQSAVRTPRPPSFSRGGAFGGAAATPTPQVSKTTPRARTATPVPQPVPTSARDHPVSIEQQRSPRAEPIDLPARGTYTYAVEGYERATGFGSRNYPNEMTLTAHRNGVDLESDEIVFDLDFSSRHEEREIVAFGPDAVSFVHEAGSVTFGPRTQSSEASYRPPMVQVPVPLETGARRTGTSEARSPDGSLVRTEDWTAKVLRRETVTVASESVDTWVVRVDRKTRPGSSEQLDRTRTYWYDAARKMWVRWQEDLRAERQFGPGTFKYETEYTATLVGFHAAT